MRVTRGDLERGVGERRFPSSPTVAAEKGKRRSPTPHSKSPAAWMAWLTIRAYTRWIVRRELRVDIQGWEHVPTEGPVVLAARHVHHLYDACALVATAPRPLHLLVAVDWTRTPMQRRLLELACAVARWPGVIRPESYALNPHHQYRREELRQRLRMATTLATDLLCEGRALLVFPEGYPVIDPWATPRSARQEMLPFHRGFAEIARRAARVLEAPIPIVPVGVRYSESRPREIQVRLGSPLSMFGWDRPDAIVAKIRVRVLGLSA